MQYQDWIIRRALEKGTLADFQVLLDWLGRQSLLERIAQLRFHDRRTAVFWEHMLQLEGIPCTSRRSPPEVARLWTN